MKLRLTNLLNLPEPIVRAIANDPYSAGDSDYTATSLLSPPRALQLERTNTIVSDALEHLASLEGQAMHSILERAAKELGELGYVVEKRFKTIILDTKISAQIDVFDPVSGTISDYKYTTVSASRHGLKDEHRMQLNVQAELVRRAGFKVDKLEVILLMKDWKRNILYAGYPLSPMVKQVVPVLSSEAVVEWIEERIRLHEAAKLSLPRCTPEERWSRPTFAVMKTVDAAKATRVFDTRVEAEAFITAKAPTSMIVERAGESIKCKFYCPVRSICEQAKEELAGEESVLGVPDADGFFKV